MSQAPTRPFRPGDDPTPYLSHPDASYEILDGQPLEKPAMGAYASLVAMRLYQALSRFLADNPLGQAVIETMLALDPSRGLQRRPDVAFISFGRWPSDRPYPRTGELNVAPDLAIEVVSPRDVHAELRRKVRDYFRFGTRQVWVVDPLDESISVYTSPTEVRILTADDALDGGDILPGLSVPIAPLFRATFL
jgi:Uma2 family endonuclease